MELHDFFVEISEHMPCQVAHMCMTGYVKPHHLDTKCVKCTENRLLDQKVLSFECLYIEMVRETIEVKLETTKKFKLLEK